LCRLRRAFSNIEQQQREEYNFSLSIQDVLRKSIESTTQRSLRQFRISIQLYTKWNEIHVEWKHLNSSDIIKKNLKGFSNSSSCVWTEGTKRGFFCGNKFFFFDDDVSLMSWSSEKFEKFEDSCCCLRFCDVVTFSKGIWKKKKEHKLLSGRLSASYMRILRLIQTLPLLDSLMMWIVIVEMRVVE
jgi:hypothetical protein